MNEITIAFYDSKPYDIEYFDKVKEDFKVKYFEAKLNADSAVMAKGAKAVVAFVNDDIGKETIDALIEQKVEVILLRSAGFNHVDVAYAKDKIKIYRVPAYSPNAVAEHAMALLLTLNRKIHRAYNRVRNFNFALNGLTGFDLHQKTIGVIGTGKIGREFIKICEGFGMNVICYDPHKIEGLTYKSLEEIFKESHIIALHCPLTKENHHMINDDAISKMKDGVYIINTSRGGLINSEALLSGINKGKIGGAGLDVYEEEAEFFYKDHPTKILNDDTLQLLISNPNVIVTSHQAFLTEEALTTISEVTIQNLKCYISNTQTDNEVKI